MRCKQCGASFKLSIWIMQCGECKDQYCTKCMKRKNGICYCEKCTVLVMRPPDITELMKLRSKDLQDYLNRHNIKTLGLVEKRELVDLLCNRTIPVKSTKSSTVINKIFSNFENVLTLPDRLNGRPTERAVYTSTSSGNIFVDSTTAAGMGSQSQTANTLPMERRPPRPPPPRPPPPSNSPPNSPSSNNSTQQPTTSTADVSTFPRKIPNLRDYATIEELSELSGKELKIVLTYNRVDYKGCVEKRELLEKVERLWHDTQKHKTDDLAENFDDLCKLCMDASLDCVLLECGHIATCIDCGKKLAECPICRQYVSRVVRTFKA